MTEAILHAYLTIDHDGARAAAEAADAAFTRGEDRGPLQGIPIALKDNMVTRGIETTCSSRILSGYRPPYDATVVERLKAGGAVILGKTNLDEFAMGSSTENSAYGPTRNPWDPDRVPGGSSRAVRRRRWRWDRRWPPSAPTPAARSANRARSRGIVGMKPTYGLVSRYGLIAFASSLDQIGPITRTVDDSVTMFETIAGHDPSDATSYRGPVPEVRSTLDQGVKGLRIGVVRELSGEGTAPDVAASFQATLDALAGAGAMIKELSLPSTEYALSAYYLIAPAECSANLARFDGVRYGPRLPGRNVEESMSATAGATASDPR